MILKDKYLNGAGNLRIKEGFNDWRQCAWRSPSNIALIKYWGKRAGQLPQNPSLSITLKKSFTETKIKYAFKQGNEFSFEFLFDGKENSDFSTRIENYLKSVIVYLPFLDQLHLKVSSRNSFPHSSGIASSASSMSALALCLVDIENPLFGTLKSNGSFYQKASFLARLGSGSAARSVYGGFVLWGETKITIDSSDEYALPLQFISSSPMGNLKDAILVVSKDKKKISSTEGHAMMKGHPYAKARYDQANQNLEKLLSAFKSENDKEIFEIIENEALSLHALMLSSKVGYRLLNENSWKIINKIIEFRAKSGLALAFTLDAGPNVHLIYKQKDSDAVREFIESALIGFCENEYWIDDETGNGPKKIE
ncbi:MAG: diphosphomevalonate decarboxylase [Bacteroidales bacterium]|nr:diphosphomevalonate decarboxylase [Bacteroidales bacterium]